MLVQRYVAGSVICEGDYAVLRFAAFPKQKSQMWCDARWKSWPPWHALRPSRLCFQRQMCWPWRASAIHVTSILRRHRSFRWPSFDFGLPRSLCNLWPTRVLHALASRDGCSQSVCSPILQMQVTLVFELYIPRRHYITMLESRFAKYIYVVQWFFFFLRSNPPLGFYLSSFA